MSIHDIFFLQEITVKGYIHNYTGNGKGKTTASLGLVVRALGAGLKVCVIQFLKNGEFSELLALGKMKSIFPEQLYFCQSGAERKLFSKMTNSDKISAERGERLFYQFLNENAYDLYVLDEINLAVHYKLLDANNIISRIKAQEFHGEIVFTGRHASQELLDAADLITEMTCLKHYIDQGVTARNGIEK